MEDFQVPGTFSPVFFLSGRTMRELGIFVDESESDGLSDRYYLITVAMRDQSDSIADSIEAYEGALRAEFYRIEYNGAINVKRI